MIITKSELRKILNEEIEKALSEELVPFLEGVIQMIEELNDKDFTQSEKIRTYLDFATRFRNRARDSQRQGAQAAPGEGEGL